MPGRAVIPALALVVTWMSLAHWPAAGAEASGIDRTRARAADADALIRSNRLRDATPILEELYADAPSNDWYLRHLAQAYSESGRARDAAPLWDVFMERSAAAVEACPFVGRDWDAVGDSIRAERAYRRCVDLDPDDDDHVLALGLFLERQNRIDEARALLSEALRTAPHYDDIRAAVVRLDLRLGRAVSSDDVRALARTSNPDALYAAGAALVRQGRHADGRAMFERAVEASPAHGDAWLAIGRDELRLGRAARAREIAERVLAKTPESADALLGLGVALEAQGRLAEAAAVLERAARVAPDYDDVARVLARVRAQLARDGR